MNLQSYFKQLGAKHDTHVSFNSGKSNRDGYYFAEAEVGVTSFRFDAPRMDEAKDGLMKVVIETLFMYGIENLKETN